MDHEQDKFLHPGEVDERLNLQPGTAERLARRRIMPHIRLPNGVIRFRWQDVELAIANVPSEVPHAK